MSWVVWFSSGWPGASWRALSTRSSFLPVSVTYLFGSNDGNEAMARIAPVLGSSATTPDSRPSDFSAAYAASWTPGTIVV